MSGIVPRLDKFNNKAKEVNDHLVQISKERAIPFLSQPENIDPSKHLNESKLHLNYHSIKVFAENFLVFGKKKEVFGKAKMTSTKEN